MQASGGLYTSANDIAGFLGAMLAGGAPVLSADSLGEMQRIAFPVADFQSTGAGLGLFVYLRADERIVSVGHGGGGYGFQSQLTWLPDVGLGMAVLQNPRAGSRLAVELDGLFSEAARRLSSYDPFAPGSAALASAPCREPRVNRTAELRGAYVARSSSALVTDQKGVFGILGQGFSPMCLLADDVLINPEKMLGDAWRFERLPDGRPDRLVDLNSGTTYAYNDGPGDLPGPGHPRWRDRLGTWTYAWWEIEPVYLTFQEVNGHLYFDELRLTEFGDGRFAASNGEVLDLASDPPTWRSVPIERQAPLPPAEEAREGIDRAAAYYELLRSKSFEAFLEASTDAVRQDLGDRLPQIWRDLVDGNGPASPLANGRVARLAGKTRVRFAAPFERAVRSFVLMFDAEGRIDGFWFETPSRTWWNLESVDSAAAQP